MRETALKNIMNSSTYKYVIKSMSCVVYRIETLDYVANMYLNNYLNNQIKHIKFYFNYFKYLAYFKQLFKNFCLIFLDINF